MGAQRAPTQFMRQWHVDDYIYWSVLTALPICLLAGSLALKGIIPLEECWIYGHLGLYCPGCGGTRAVLALLRGQILRSLYYHPAVVILSVVLLIYLPVQTICRLRKRTIPGWCRYRPMWLYLLIAMLLVNCVVRNLLNLCFEIPL